MNKKLLFTSESVNEGHPDKLCDQVSDAILDECLKQDPNSKVACETSTGTNFVIVFGEITTNAVIDYEKVVRDTLRYVGFDHEDKGINCDTCEVIVKLHSQSPDIAQGVHVGKKDEDIGAGDQGIMFGYANNETDEYIPMTLDLSHKILIELAAIRKSRNEMKYLRPDSKCQVTIQYDNKNRPEKIISIVLSTQHDEFDSDKIMHETIEDDIKSILIPKIKKINSAY